MAQAIVRVVVSGPESSGKTTLVHQLTQHFGGIAVPEFARTYLEAHGPAYDFDTLSDIGRGQLAAEQEAMSRAAELSADVAHIFVDTSLLVIRVWSQVVYGKSHPWIDEELRRSRYDLHLLTAPDLPWQPDPLRQNPSQVERERIFQRYQQELLAFNQPFHIVSGIGYDRLNEAKKLITLNARART